MAGRRRDEWTTWWLALPLVVMVLVGFLPARSAVAGPLGEAPRVDTELTGDLQGMVTSAEDGLELPHVQLVLRRQGSREIVSVMRTGRRGRYRFEELEAGIYSIEAQASGFLPTIRTPLVIRPGDEPRVEDITLTPVGGGRAS